MATCSTCPEMVAQTFRQQALSFNDKILKHLMQSVDFEAIERRPKRNRAKTNGKRSEELEQLDTFLEVEVERYSARSHRRACTDSDVEYGSYKVVGGVTRRKRSGSPDEIHEETNDTDVASFVSTQEDLDCLPHTELEDINSFIASAEPYTAASLGYQGVVCSQSASMQAVSSVPAFFAVPWPCCPVPMVTAFPPLSSEAVHNSGRKAGRPASTVRSHAEDTVAKKHKRNGSGTQTAISEEVLPSIAPGLVLSQAAVAKTVISDITSVCDSAQAINKPKTTVMLRNLPNDYTRAMVLDLFDSEGFKGQYDFVYVPIDFRSWAGLGYCFVNLSSEAVERFMEHFDGYRGWTIPSQKVCRVSWGEPLQGLEEHIERYRNSSVMHEEVPDELKPVLFENGERVEFPPPTKRIRPMRIKHRC